MSGVRNGYRVGLLVDHVTRDLNVCAYVSNLVEACGDGNRTWVDHLEFRNRWKDYDYFERTRRSADLVVLPSYNVRRTPSLLARAIRHGARIVMNHSEQIFASAYDREKLNLDHLEAYRRRVTAHLVWGDAFARRLVEEVGVDPARIYVVGNPKLDLSARLARETEAGSGRDVPTALFVSDFRLGDFGEAEWKRFKRQYRAEFVAPLNQVYRQGRERFVAWIREAAPRHPSLRILVRPHPGEGTEAYQPLRGFPNVEVGNDGEFGADLRQAAAVFQFTSTSVFESLVLGKPVYNLAVADLPEESRATHHGAFEWISREQMGDLLASLSRGERLATAEWKEAVLEEHMHRPKGNSLFRTAVAIDHIARALDPSASAWTHPADRLAARLYTGVAALKYGLIRGAHIAAEVGLRNPVERWSRKRWASLRDGAEYLDDEIVDAARERVSAITDPRELKAFCERAFEVHLGRFAQHIELDREVEARHVVQDQP